MPLRRSYRPGAAPETPSTIGGVPMVVAWAGGGILLAALALGLALVAGRAGEDPAAQRADSVFELPAEAPAPAPAPPAAAATDPSANDFELPDDEPSQAKPAKRGRAHSRAPRSASW